MAARSKKQVKAIKEGQVEITDDHFLDYTILTTGIPLITQESFFRYLEFAPGEKKFEEFAKLSDATVQFQSISGEVKIGFTISGLIAFCLGLLQIKSASQLLARRVTIFVMFLATTGLNQLIEEKIDNSQALDFGETLIGVVNIPKP